MDNRVPEAERTSAAISESSAASEGQKQYGSSMDMAGILQGLQVSLSQLTKSSERQTETLQSLKEYLFLLSDGEDSR